jgi:O-antigen/teichoic acid export membrane protein
VEKGLSNTAAVLAGVEPPEKVCPAPPGRSSVIRQAGLLAGGTVISQLILVAAAPLLTRIYSPDAFGAVALYVSIASVIAILSSLRYELAIPLADTHEDAARLTRICLWLVAATAGFCAIATWSPARALFPDSIAGFIWLLPVSVLAMGAAQCLTLWAVRVEQFRRISTARIAQSLVTATTQVFSGRFAALGLAAGEILGRLTGGGSLYRKASDVRNEGAVVKPAGAVQLMKRFRNLPLVGTWGALLNALSLQAPLLLLAGYFDTRVCGGFALASRMLAVPISLVGQALGMVFLSRASAVKSDTPKLGALTESTALSLFALGLPVFLGLFAAGPQIFGFCFGPEWTGAGEMVRWLAPWYLLWIVASPLSSLLTIREWQGTSVLFTAAELAGKCAAIVAGAMVFGNSDVAINLLSISGVIICLISIARFVRAGYASAAKILKGAARIAKVSLLCHLPLLACVWWQVSPAVILMTAAASVAANYAVLFMSGLVPLPDQPGRARP